ncbi:MAG: hypothetical protein AAFR75_11995, partial [Pseudomonadota bacterium]
DQAEEISKIRLASTQHIDSINKQKWKTLSERKSRIFSAHGDQGATHTLVGSGSVAVRLSALLPPASTMPPGGQSLGDTSLPASSRKWDRGKLGVRPSKVAIQSHFLYLK